MNFALNRLSGIRPQPNPIPRVIIRPNNIVKPTISSTNNAVYRTYITSNMLGRLQNGGPCASCGN